MIKIPYSTSERQIKILFVHRKKTSIIALLCLNGYAVRVLLKTREEGEKSVSFSISVENGFIRCIFNKIPCQNFRKSKKKNIKKEKETNTTNEKVEI